MSARALLPWGPLREWVPCTYLVEGRHGSGAHHQGYADDGVAVEAVRVGHHDDARDGEDGRHDLKGGREGDSVSLRTELQVPENGNVLLVGLFQVDRGGSWVSCRGHLSKLSLTKTLQRS